MGQHLIPVGATAFLGKRRRGHDLFDQVIDCAVIRTHFRTRQRAAEVGRSCAVSIPCLSHRFKDHAGESPYDFLTRLKMSYVADLVLHHARDIKHLATAVGFVDPCHRLHACKKFYGTFPIHFRRDVHRP